MKRILFFSILLSLLLSSCLILSFHPLYDKDTAVALPQLEGSWLVEEETWTIERNDDEELPGYYLTQYTKEQEVHYDLYIVQLGEFYFLDIVADTGDSPYSLSYPYPMHSFYKLQLSETDNPKLYIFDSEYLEELFQQRKIRIKHEYDPEIGIFVLTAPTEELQQFMLKYGDDPRAFIEPAEMVRKE